MLLPARCFLPFQCSRCVENETVLAVVYGPGPEFAPRPSGSAFGRPAATVVPVGTAAAGERPGW